MKKTLLAASVMLALGASSASLAGFVTVDRNGAAAGGQIEATGIIWATGNLLFGGIVGAAIQPGVLHGHHNLSSFNGAGVGAVAGTEITMVYDVPVLNFTSIAGGATPGTNNEIVSLGGGTFAIYYDDFTSGSAFNAELGTGYADGRVILTGIFDPHIIGISSAGTIKVTTAVTGPLDAGADTDNTDVPGCVWPGPCVPGTGGGVTTSTVSGSVSFNIEITGFDPTFFPNGIDVDPNAPLVVDLTYTATAATPFSPPAATEPSDVVGLNAVADVNATCVNNVAGVDVVVGCTVPLMGKVPNYGEAVGPFVNDQACASFYANPDMVSDQTTGTSIPIAHTGCDIHAAGTADSTFGGTFVPEPGSVALLGLGLGVLGVAGRRRRGKAS